MEENQESEKGTRVYEVGFLLTPTLTDEKLLQVFAAIKETLGGASPAMLGEGFPKPRPLTYPINKYESAFFGWLKFESGLEVLATLREFLKNNAAVIRFLIVKTIRENPTTPVFFGKTRERTEKQVKVKEALAAGTKMTTEELDKTIEELVVE